MTINEIYEKLNNIEYGWVDKNNVKHYKLEPALFSQIYMLQTPEELLNSKIGVCWDQVELERYYFNKTSLKYNSYDIIYIDNNNMPNHTFFVYEDNNKFYWFEHAWDKYKGIHEYDNLKNLLLTVKKNFIADELKGNCNEEKLYLFSYYKPKDHLDCTDFYKHMMSGNNISNITKE
jgi:hypothetical protein